MWLKNDRFWMMQKCSTRGKAALRGVAATLISMVNPVSLATLGIIAGGAALFQWATAADEADGSAEKFSDALAEIKKQASDAKIEVDLFLGGFSSAAEMTLQG